MRTQLLSVQKAAITDTLPGNCVITLTKSNYDYVIADSYGVIAERINGKWQIKDCVKALEVFYKRDSSFAKNNK